MTNIDSSLPAEVRLLSQSQAIHRRPSNLLVGLAQLRPLVQSHRKLPKDSMVTAKFRPRQVQYNKDRQLLRVFAQNHHSVQEANLVQQPT